MKLLLLLIFGLKVSAAAYEPAFGLHRAPTFILSSSFASDYCSLKCNNVPHTLCEQPKRRSDCKGFEMLEIDEELKEQLVYGHNGLRARFARKQNAASMRMLEWDDELAKMAKMWANTCDKYAADPCTQLEPNKSAPYTMVNQNSKFIRTRYFPDRFVTSRLRNWYLEKRNVRIKVVENTDVYLDRKSNFSQIIWAQTERLGCAIFRVKEGYRLICNYWPFTGIKSPAYLQGPACSLCPRRFPLCSQVFEGLCTNRAHERHSKYAILNSLAMIALAVCLQNFELN